MILWELFLIFVLILIVIVIYHIFKAIKHLVVNSILGLLVIFAANFLFGLNIAYTWFVILICAIGGLVGAIIVILLHLLFGFF